MSLCNDTSFGPGSSCRPLDFTLTFEGGILSLVPDVLFLVLALFRLNFVRAHSERLIQRKELQFYAKCVASLLLIGSSAASLATYAVQLRHLLPSIFLPAYIISFVASLLLSVLVLFEHFRSPAPGSLIICYCLAKGFFQAVVLRSYHQTGLSSIATPAFALLALDASTHFLFMLIELIEKKHLMPTEVQEKHIGESTFSFLTRSFFFWLLPLMWRGRNSKITLDDLTPNIPESNQAIPARTPLLEALKAQAQSSGDDKGTFHPSLLRATFRAFGTAFFIPVVPRLVLLVATFLQPYLVSSMISLISDPNASSERGWALVGGFVCVYWVMMIATSVYWEKVYAITTQYRAALVGVIYGKSLKLAAYESRTIGTGAASTYMSVDVERISEGVEIIHEFWAALVSIPIAIAQLYQQASWAAFPPLGVTIIILAITSSLGKSVGRNQAQWLAVTDKRVKLLSSILGQFLPIKMSGYENHLSRKVTRLREDEMHQAFKFYLFITVTAALSNAASVFCALSVLATYAGITSSSSNLDPTRIFTILTTVNLLSSPLNMLGQGLPDMLAAYASMKRIQTFLSLDEKNADAYSPELRAQNEKGMKVELVMHNACFTWNGTDKKASPGEGQGKEKKDIETEKTDAPVIALRDVNLSLYEGKLHMLVGPVASGKSTLLLSMLGETTLVSGELKLPKDVRIGYASQDSFVVVGTCRENILFGRPYIPDWYNTVIEACALPTDFASLPFGDMTKLSDKGTTLSGGQRQRLALARAVYADAPLLLLDDVLSALDGETEKHVFNALCGSNGLLQGKTVVLATHGGESNTQFHHLSSADWVFVLDAGRLVQQGTFADVRDAGYDLAASKMAEMEEGSEGTSSSATADTKAASKKKEDEDAHDDTEDDETARSYDKAGWAPYKFFVQNIGYYRVILSFLLVLFYVGVKLGTQGYLKQWSESDGTHLGRWLGGYVAFSVSGFITGIVLFAQYALSITLFGGINMHQAELTAVFHAPSSFFLSTPVGRILNRFSSDIFVIDFTFPIAVLNGVSSAATILGTLILMYIATPWLAISAPVMAVGYWLLIKFYLGTSKQFQQLESASKSPLYTTFANTMTGLETMRAFKVQSYFQMLNDKSLNESQGPFYFRFGGMRFLRTTLAGVTLLIAVGIACLAVALRSTTSAGFLGIALSNLVNLSQQLSQFLMVYSQMENGSVSIHRIHEMAHLEPERDDAGYDEASLKKSSWPVKGTIVFEDYSQKYREELPPALDNVSFTVKGGQRIGICGRTGSGKSSTVMALFRAMDQSLITGKIYIDGVDIATLPLSVLRNSLSLVSQEPFLWNDTVRHLLDVEGICMDEEVWDALERVSLKDAISAFPDKLDHVVEDGSSLSRGQRQLMCLARALLRKSKIVVLDEATSSMDLRTDEKIREVVQHDMIDQTIVAVAHRIATIIDFDLILVLDKGHVAEFGSPQSLLANPNSRFSRLAATQGLGSSETALELVTEIQ